MAKDCQGVGFVGGGPMLRIITEVDAPPGQAIGVKEALAMEAERYGDTRVVIDCLLYTSPSPRDTERSRMPSSA